MQQLVHHHHEVLGFEQGHHRRSSASSSLTVLPTLSSFLLPSELGLSVAGTDALFPESGLTTWLASADDAVIWQLNKMNDCTSIVELTICLLMQERPHGVPR